MNGRNLTLVLERSLVLSIAAAAIFAQSADKITIHSPDPDLDDSQQVPVTFFNENEIVALQFDIDFPLSQLDVGNPSVTTETTNHEAETQQQDPGMLRVVVFSPSNQLLPDDLILEVPMTLQPSAPAAGVVIRLKNILLTDRLGNAFSPVVGNPLLDAWKEIHFSEAETMDDSVAGDNADPDRDGAINIFEYLTGGNPKLRDAERSGKIAVDFDPETNEPMLTYLFRRGKEIGTALLEVETSVDMIEWTTDDIAVTATGEEDATSIEFKASLVIENGDEVRRFLRLKGNLLSAE